MSERADEGTRAVAWQLGIGVQGDHVANLRQDRLLADRDLEGGIGRAAQVSVEFDELAALALPAHVAGLPRVPDAPSME